MLWLEHERVTGKIRGPIDFSVFNGLCGRVRKIAMQLILGCEMVDSKEGTTQEVKV